VQKTRKRNIEMEMCWEERKVYWEVRMTGNLRKKCKSGMTDKNEWN
jgi:hypothetical protein